MPRPEITGTRNLDFSGWIRSHLPDSNTGYLVTDIDFLLYNYKSKKVMLLEVKTNKATIREWQKRLFENLARWIQNGIDDDWRFLGFNRLEFENLGFADGKAFLNDKQVSEQEVIEFLSF